MLNVVELHIAGIWDIREKKLQYQFFFFKKIFVGHMSIFGATDTHVSDCMYWVIFFRVNFSEILKLEVQDISGEVQ